MKKFLSSIFILLALIVMGLLFILPYGLGFVAQNKYTQILNTFSKAGAVQMVLLDYQRGWFSSNATIKTTFQSKSSAVNPQTLIIQQEIEHGPLFSFISQKGEKSILLGQGLIISHVNSVFGTVDIVNWIKWDGAFWGIVHMPLLRFSDTPNDQDVIVNNLSGVFKFSGNMKRFSANFRVPEILVKTNKLERRIERVNLSYNLQKSMSDLYLGQCILTIRSMLWDSPPYFSKLKFEGLDIRSYDAEKNRRIKDKIDLELKRIVVNNASYGPQKISLTVDQLDTPTLLALKKEFSKLRNDANFSSQTLEKYQQLFGLLVSKGLAIQLEKLQLVTPWGNSFLKADIQVPAQPFTNNDIKRLLAAANVMIEANIPAPFLIRTLEKFYTVDKDEEVAAASRVNGNAMAQQLVSDWTNKKWLIPKDNGYQITALYKNRQFIINGQPITYNNK